MKYTLAGAYDSNIALLLTVGESRLETYQNLAEVIRRTSMTGRDLATNLEFHYVLSTILNTRHLERLILSLFSVTWTAGLTKS